MNEIEYENYYIKLKPEYNTGDFANKFTRQFDEMIT